MGRTPDRRPGPLIEEKIILQDDGYTADNPGEAVYKDGAFSMRDSVGAFDPRSGSGLSETQHENLDTLVHELAKDRYEEITRSGGVVTNHIVYTDSGKTTKIRETNITRSAGKVSEIEIIQYESGSEKYTLTGTVARSSGSVSDITWVKTTP